MKNIYLDGEEVLFNGPSPNDMPSLQALLTQHAQDNNRVLTRWLVDGVDLFEEADIPPPQDYKKIEAFSEDQATILKQLINHHSKQSSQTLECIDSFGHKVLSHPWGNLSHQFSEIINTLIPFVELLGHLQSFGEKTNLPWLPETSQLLAQFDDLFTRIPEYAANTDIAALSDAFLMELKPLLTKSINFLSSNITL